MIKYYNGIPVHVPNAITANNTEEKYYVSYNPSFRDYGVDTTALVITIGENERQVFYILKGNHTERFGKCTNLNECLDYYVENKDLQHKMSDSFEH